MDVLKSMLKKVLGQKCMPLLELYYLSRYWLNRGSLRFCPCCEKGLQKFLPADIGARHAVPEIRCPRCDSHPRHRLLWLFLLKKCPELFNTPLRLLHIAPEFCFLRQFKRIETLDYVTGDLDSPLAKERLDVTQLPYPENSFDVLFCNHVLEHVPNDRGAMAELYRVLKPGGWALLQVPVDMVRKVTYENKEIVGPAERVRHFGQIDHVRIYGADYVERLKQVGFDVHVADFVDAYDNENQEYFGLEQGEPIFFCIKIKK